MRRLFILSALALLVMSCGDDTMISIPKDMAVTVTPHDCGHVVYCSCQDGTCQRGSSCGGPGPCDTLCLDHGGTGGMSCVGDALF